MTDQHMPRWQFAIAFILVLAACGRQTRPTVVVFAASSLSDAFGDLEADFEARQKGEGVDVVVSFAGSQVLRHQIEQGALADVYASANVSHFEALADAGLVERDVHPVPFAQNELVLVVPTANPADIQSFEDLPKAARLVLGSEAVPVGAYARELIEAAQTSYGSDFGPKVLDGLVSEEPNVRLVRAKVELGEADAAIVYRSDVVGREATLRAIELPQELARTVPYEVGIVTSTHDRASSAMFIDYLHSAPAQEILRSWGFGVP